jgi:hypothetical protein
MGEMRNTYKILVGKPEGKRPLGRPRRRWKDNIRIDLRKIRWECGLDASVSGQGSVAVSCEEGYKTSGSIMAGNFVAIRVTISFSRERKWSNDIINFEF